MKLHTLQLAVGGALFAAAGLANQGPPQPASLRTQVVLLGTGNPNPNPDASGPATAIVVDGEPYLIDMGPGVVRRAAAAQRKGIEALAPTKIKRVFVTHLHADHTVGYPDLIFTPWVIGRKEPLEVYGPVGINAMTEHILAAWGEHIRLNNQGTERNIPEHSDDGYRVKVHEISPGVIYRDAHVAVTAFAVKHGDWGPNAFGYRFQTADRSIVISGDTTPTESVVQQCNGCDILIHEVYTETGYQKSDPSWQALGRDYHTSSRQLAELATRARPKLLILYHQSYQYTLSTEEDLVREMRAVYSGRFVSGHDLDVY
jgi:ribonuclease Z